MKGKCLAANGGLPSGCAQGCAGVPAAERAGGACSFGKVRNLHFLSTSHGPSHNILPIFLTRPIVNCSGRI